MARHQSPERIQLIFGGPPPAVVFHSMYTTPAFELCEDIIHSGPSEREMRHTRNAHNRSDYMSEVNNNFNNLKPKCACRDTATDTPKRSVEKDPNDNEWEYGDGDQSPMDQKVFFSQFAPYMDPQSDIHSLGAKQRSQCPVMDECFHGNLDKIKAHIKDQPRHLNRRITPMRESCLAYVIFGYTHLKSPGHVKCVKFLVDEGAPVNGKDAGGNTPLISVIGGWIRAEETGWNGQHEEMAEFLFERGADINMKNRFGESPLFTAAMQASNDSRCIRWLLDNGADPGDVDNDGVVLYDFAMISKVGDVMSAHMMKICKKMREEAIEKGVIRRCKFCGKEALKKCSGCFLAYYCGKECQNEGWKYHKKECKETLKGYKMFRPRNDQFSYRVTVPGSGQVVNWYPRVLHEPRGKANYVVKIQAPWRAEREREEYSINESGKLVHKPLNKDMLIHNEKKTIFGMIAPDMDHYDELLKTIRRRGVLGVKAYFYAFWEGGATEAKCGLKVNIKEVQPPETW